MACYILVTKRWLNDHPLVLFCNVKSYCELDILLVNFQGLGVRQRSLMHELHGRAGFDTCNHSQMETALQ